MISSVTSLPVPVPATPLPAPVPESPKARGVVDTIDVSTLSTSQDAGSAPLAGLLDTTALASLVGKQMKCGEVISIASNGKTVLEVKKSGTTAFEATKKVAIRALDAAVDETNNMVGQEPSFAFKSATLGVKSQVYSGMPQSYLDLAEKGFYPMIRFVALAIDAGKAVKTFHDPASNHVDKTIDSLHLVTDLAGLAGAACLAIPAVPGMVATGLAAAGLVGDVGAFGYHVMKYFKERGLPTPSLPGT